MKVIDWKRFVVILIMSTLAACGSEEETEESSIVTNPSASQRGDWVSVRPVGSISQGVYAAIFDSGELPSLAAGDAQYDVGSYHMVYKTEDPLGNVIDVSGVLALPSKPAGSTSPILSYQHPTIFLDSEAPTNTASSDFYTFFASSLGYIMVIPDYIGYGESLGQMHTYVHEQGLANAVVDMLRATQQYLAYSGINWNGQLFLTGYSEGGYANMAAHKELETTSYPGLSVTAAVHGGGPYDVLGSMTGILDAATLVSPSYVGFVLKAYDTYEFIPAGGSRISDMFSSSPVDYVTVINTNYDGFHSSSTTDAALTDVTADLFNATFLTDFRGVGETDMKAIFAANDVYNWVPAAPTGLYHGEFDTVVPYANATTAFAAMEPVPTGNVELETCSIPSGIIDDAHILCVPGYLDYMITYFGAIATDL